jgi:hypothetical protein
MINIKIRHLKNERDTWLRALDYMQQENVFLKNCLADVIQTDITTEMLERAEYFQNQFINKDTVIALLRYDVAGQNKLYEDDKETTNNLATVQKIQNRLRKDMAQMEKDFNFQKFQFNNYMAEAL